MLPLLLTTLALAAPCDAPTPHVDAAEACDGVDNNSDGSVDEGCP